MSFQDRLLMTVALIDQVTKPLQGITAQMQTTVDAGRQGMANMASGGAGLVAAGFAIQNALMPAIEMDRKIGEVKSLGVTDAALKQLQATALDFSVEYGKSAEEFVAASYDIQSAIAGLSGDELSQFTKASGVLAAATKADTGTITNYMGTMYGIFKNQAAEMGRGEWVEQVAGMTASAVQMFKTTGAEMSSAFTSIGAEATSVGIGMNEQMAILGTLQATMSGSEAGTKYRAFLNGVAKAQDELNMSFTDSQGQMLPMIDILEQLKGRYGETISVAESAELTKAFGTQEAVGMIKLLMADTAGLAQNIDALGQVQGMSKAEEMAASMTDQWERLEAVFFAVRASVFGAVLPSINTLVASMIDGITVLTTWIHEFPILGEIMGYAAIAGISLAGVVAVLSLAMGIGQMMSAGWALTMTALSGVFKLLRIQTILMTASAWLFNAALWASPITWVVAGFVALIAIVGAAIYWWDELKASFGDTAVFKYLADTIDWVISMLNKVPGVDIDFKAGELPQAPGIDIEKQAQTTEIPAMLSMVTQTELPPLSPAMASIDSPELEAPALTSASQIKAGEVPPMLSFTAPETVPMMENTAQPFMPETPKIPLIPEVPVMPSASEMSSFAQPGTPDVDIAQQIQAVNVTSPVVDTMDAMPAFENTSLTSDESLPSVTPYQLPQNQTQLPQGMVSNVTTVNKAKPTVTRQYGDVFITTQNAFTPDQLAQWDELNAG
ncbi:phage tail tape measure protein [Psychromonas ossibalaenae]|uniref:phage tail tape measure protein n=1 Tax=Psychromonas ossibalaenae TaxID=444922 RepID=UPI000382CDE2|nr:phage tail tape measure protein [Psychromonas ossibalaenae]